uniref:GPS domain-containing protein n=1 Tax=Haemonchus contortus TaxID=6289 RepID=A0A7I4YYS1_HAECO
MSCAYRIIPFLIHSSMSFGTTTLPSIRSLPVGNYTGKCVNTFPPQCDDELCYGAILRHTEGQVFRLGCLSTLTVDQSFDCKTALLLSTSNSTCIDTGLRQVCCCFPGSEECNSLWKPKLRLARLNAEEAVLLVLSIVLILFIFRGLNWILKFATMEWGSEIPTVGGDKFTSIELNFGIVKLMILLALLISLWYPIIRDCEDHVEGVFEEKYFFIAQLFDSYMTGLLYCIYPLFLLMVDLNRIRYMTMRYIICRTAHTCISLVTALLALVPLALFTYQSFHLYRQEKEVKYCKLRKQWNRLVLNSVAYFIYIVIVLAQEGVQYMFTQNNNPGGDDSAMNSPEQQIFNESIREQLETAKSNTIVEKEEVLRITPRPFIIDNSGEGVLSLENLDPCEWITVRVLISAPRSYAVHPQKVIIPPHRSSTISVRLRNDVEIELTRESGLMLQWFTVGTNCPGVDVTRLWQRPYIKPRKCWYFYVLPIFHESQEASMETARPASTVN